MYRVENWAFGLCMSSAIKVVIAAANAKEGRVLVELEYSARGHLEYVHWQRVSLSGLSGRELERIRAEGASLRKRRLALISKQRKIGRNEHCPCGSGKKYKRCCGN